MGTWRVSGSHSGAERSGSSSPSAGGGGLVDLRDAARVSASGRVPGKNVGMPVIRMVLIEMGIVGKCWCVLV